MTTNFLIGSLAAFIFGASKGGLKGLGILAVSMMLIAYGAKNSTGIVLPLLILGDIIAVIYFKKHVKTKYLIQFLPAMIIGVLVAVKVGESLDEALFKQSMAAIIIFSTLYMFWNEYRPIKTTSDNWFFTKTIGFAAGFTTMIGNLAGPFANLYFLATRLPKNEIVGTAAWVFFIINIFKLPFHIFRWKTISLESFGVSLYLMPSIIIGFFAGSYLLQFFSEKNYRRFLLFFTALGAILVFL